MRALSIATGLLISVLLVPACTSRQERHDEKEKTYLQKLDPLVGIGTREKLAELFGAPARKETVEGQEIWGWRFRNRKSAEDPLVPHPSTGGSGEDLMCTFDAKGLLESWRVTIPK